MGERSAHQADVVAARPARQLSQTMEPRALAVRNHTTSLFVCQHTHTHTHTHHHHHPITHTYTRTHTHACLSARLSRIRLCRIRQPFLVVGNNTHGPATGAFDTARQEPDIGVPTRYAADAGGEAERPTGQLQESRAGGGVQAQALAMARRARSGGGARRCSVQRVPERL